jgi:hypothetical protein
MATKHEKLKIKRKKEKSLTRALELMVSSFIGDAQRFVSSGSSLEQGHSRPTRHMYIA